MTQVGRISFGPLLPHTLGLERFFDDVERLSYALDTGVKDNYPPHNIAKVGDNKYLVELAVAGFSKDEIEISAQDSVLTITGQKKASNTPEVTYTHRGIATRAFTKKLSLADTIEIRGAELKDGILRIGLENIIPDHKKPRKVEIVDSLESLPQQKLLQE